MTYCHGQALLDRAADGRDYPEPYFTPPKQSEPDMCINCKWSQELEERYDQVRCCCEKSPHAFGNVEASGHCEQFTRDNHAGN